MAHSGHHTGQTNNLYCLDFFHMCNNFSLLLINDFFNATPYNSCTVNRICAKLTIFTVLRLKRSLWLLSFLHCYTWWILLWTSGLCCCFIAAVWMKLNMLRSLQSNVSTYLFFNSLITVTLKLQEAAHRKNSPRSWFSDFHGFYWKY